MDISTANGVSVVQILKATGMANPLPVRGVIYLENGSSNPLIMVPSVFLSLMSEVLLPCQLIFSRWRLDIHVYVPLYEHKYTYIHT